MVILWPCSNFKQTKAILAKTSAVSNNNQLSLVQFHKAWLKTNRLYCKTWTSKRPDLCLKDSSLSLLSKLSKTFGNSRICKPYFTERDSPLQAIFWQHNLYQQTIRQVSYLQRRHRLCSYSGATAQLYNKTCATGTHPVWISDNIIFKICKTKKEKMMKMNRSLSQRTTRRRRFMI